ncbi:MAG: FAD binding domain-containing protein [Thermoplasmata archaeon]
MSSFDLVAPASEAEAIAWLARTPDGETAVLAGGTDLLNDLEEQRIAPRHLLSLRRLPWNRWSWNGPALTIGSTTPLVDLEYDPKIRADFPGLVSAIEAVGSVALRSRATLGGNLGRSGSASDLIPMLLALDASAEVVGSKGRRTLPVDALVVASRRPALAPGELIRSVLLPEPRPSAYLWQRIRPAQDVSHVGVAVAFSPGDGRWRIGLGGVPPRAIRIHPLASELPERPSPSVLDAAARRAAERLPLATDLRATGAYRRLVVHALVHRAVGAAGATRGGPA